MISNGTGISWAGQQVAGRDSPVVVVSLDMSSVGTTAAAQTALAQSLVKSDIATHLLKMTQETEQREADLVQEVIEAVAETNPDRQVDVYA